MVGPNESLFQCAICGRDTDRSFWDLDLSKCRSDHVEVEVHWSESLLAICKPCADRTDWRNRLADFLADFIVQESKNCPPASELEPIVPWPDWPDAGCGREM